MSQNSRNSIIGDMLTNGEVSKTTSKSKPRKLPEIPKDQVAYDVNKPPKKPARLFAALQVSPRLDFKKLSPRASPRLDVKRPSPQVSPRLDHKRAYLQVSPYLDINRSGVQVSPQLGPTRHPRYNKRSSSLTDITSTSYCKIEDLQQTGMTGKPPERNKSISLSDLSDDRAMKQYKNYTLLSNDAILSRRCGSCYQRIFPESEPYLAAQSYLFHTSCFCCAICNISLDVTNYCYFIDHEKFYCFPHYHEISQAEEQLGSDKRRVTGVGPGVLAGLVLSYSSCYSLQRKRKRMIKKLIELQHRRSTLEAMASQLEKTRTNAQQLDKLFLWQHWFDITYEKMIIMKGVTELAYQLKESELSEEQEQIQRKLRRLKKRRDEGTREENTEQERKCLQSVLDVIEKRDLLLLELEIERRRDDEEVETLKSARKQTGNYSEPPSNSRKLARGESLFSTNELLDDCVIL